MPALKTVMEQQPLGEVVERNGSVQRPGQPARPSETWYQKLGEVVVGILPPAFYAYGGPVAVAVLQERLVNQRKWVDHEGFMDLMALAMVLPGPTTTAMVIGLGLERGGPLGGLVGFLCWTTPSVIVLTAMGAAMASVSSGHGSRPAWLGGLAPSGVMLIFVACIKLGTKVVKSSVQLVLSMLSIAAVLLVEDDPRVTPKMIMISLPVMLLSGGLVTLGEAYVVQHGLSLLKRLRGGGEQEEVQDEEEKIGQEMSLGQGPVKRDSSLQQPGRAPSLAGMRRRSIVSLASLPPSARKSAIDVASTKLLSRRLSIERMTTMDCDFCDEESVDRMSTGMAWEADLTTDGGTGESMVLSRPGSSGVLVPSAAAMDRAKSRMGSFVRAKVPHRLHPGMGLLALLVLLTLVTLSAGMRTFLPNASHALHMFGSFFLVALTGFGGGNVMMPILINICVRAGWLTEDQFVEGIAIAQMLPGPFLTVGAYIGMIYQGLPGAVAGYLGLNLPALLLVHTTLPLWHRFIGSAPAVRVFLNGVNCVGLGLMISVAVSLFIKVVRTAAAAVVATAVATTVGLLNKGALTGVVVGIVTGVLLSPVVFDLGQKPIGT